MVNGEEVRNTEVSAEGLMDFLKAQARDAVSVATSSDLSHSLQPRDVVPGTGEKSEKPVIILAKVREGQEENLDLLRKVSTHFLDTECNFHVNVVPGELETSVTSFDAVPGNEKSFPGQMQNFLELLQWARSQCVPLVRELKFENAEALTEEGLPFLVLFRDPDDEASLQIFRDIINDELPGEQDKVNFLYADGFVFKHPLEYLGKTPQDFPVIALDDFNYIFGLPTDANFEDPGVLKAFIQDLHSGKLHEDFHSGEPLAIRVGDSGDGDPQIGSSSLS
ncbi:unnamed protein product [Notodromas monacha]|uniref:Uncharacterized protein n=1 Tax=Notodromas monacha TaxID=399045 RepID=A0A7R9GBK5_9CRUS|nr:unnamed protein product [Notodromas monacha]CAG0916622.1 unnamed protein product [Notodromas monacha]